VLFSEPKIPQKKCGAGFPTGASSFSALQRAENSSRIERVGGRGAAHRFSALQRAENSSTYVVTTRALLLIKFQCSSASRKFLNPDACGRWWVSGAFQCSSASRKFLKRFEQRIFRPHSGFSALQRAENSSIDRAGVSRVARYRFSALQRAENSSTHLAADAPLDRHGFSALQRAENSSIYERRPRVHRTKSFSALQRAENSSTTADYRKRQNRDCFSALQRAENSSMLFRLVQIGRATWFQCSSASRKFLNNSTAPPAPSLS